MGLKSFGVKQEVPEMQSTHLVSHFILGVGGAEEEPEIHVINGNERTREKQDMGEGVSLVLLSLKGQRPSSGGVLKTAGS